MNYLMTISFLLLSFSISAQKYFTKTGTTELRASVDTFEPVEAVSKSTTAILNTSNGEVAALLFIKTFHFKVALMEEHFNENYMDSDEFPKASFKGKIEAFDLSNLGEEEKAYKMTGSLTIKGIEKEIETMIQVKSEQGALRTKSSFSVSPADFEIAIPKIVRNKISQEINISFEYELVEKK